ncbi:TMhelix containing protein [Vibrio phage 2.275.O._10N.286.54.E11]|nr:TMhelix containing protein [Vibrio phage 2.275.O._10N.286.54.E11]
MELFLFLLFVYLVVGAALYATHHFDEEPYESFCTEKAVTYAIVGVAVFGIRIYKRAASIIEKEL